MGDNDCPYLVTHRGQVVHVGSMALKMMLKGLAHGGRIASNVDGTKRTRRTHNLFL
jgi:hypothetical protein